MNHFNLYPAKSYADNNMMTWTTNAVGQCAKGKLCEWADHTKITCIVYVLTCAKHMSNMFYTFCFLKYKILIFQWFPLACGMGRGDEGDTSKHKGLHSKWTTNLSRMYKL